MRVDPYVWNTLPLESAGSHASIRAAIWPFIPATSSCTSRRAWFSTGNRGGSSHPRQPATASTVLQHKAETDRGSELANDDDAVALEELRDAVFWKAIGRRVRHMILVEHPQGRGKGGGKTTRDEIAPKKRQNPSPPHSISRLGGVANRQKLTSNHKEPLRFEVSSEELTLKVIQSLKT